MGIFFNSEQKEKYIKYSIYVNAHRHTHAYPFSTYFERAAKTTNVN